MEKKDTWPGVDNIRVILGKQLTQNFRAVISLQNMATDIYP